MGEEDSSARNGPRITRVSNGTPNRAVTQSELVHFVRPSTDLLVESVATSLKRSRHSPWSSRELAAMAPWRLGHPEDGRHHDHPGLKDRRVLWKPGARH